jgi:shikimate kinase
MGCGKSSVGRKLSQLLCCPFMDLDQVIEEREGRSIPEIFSRDGEPEFRRIELEALKHIVGERPSLVLALGGGAVMTAECAEIVHSDTICIYLKASVDTLMEHLSGQTGSRPLLDSSSLKERIETLMTQRSATYEKTAHIIIDTDGKSIEAVASEIISIIREELV